MSAPAAHHYAPARISPRTTLRLLLALVMPVFLLLVLLRLLHPKPDDNVFTLSSVHIAQEQDLALWRMPERPQPVALPHERRGGHDRIVYFFVLDLQVPPDRLWAVYLPHLSMNAAVHLNGEILGHGGSMVPPVARHWNRPLYFTIPNGLLRSGHNVLAVESIGDPVRSGFLAPVYVGPHETLMRVYEQRFALTVVAALAITTMLITVAVLMCTLWAMRRSASVYLWFGLGAAAWAAHNFNLFVVHTPMPAVAWEWLWNVTMGWLVIFTVIFVLRFLDERLPRLERTLFGFGFVGSVALALIAAWSPNTLAWVGPHVWDSGVLLLGAYPVVKVLRRLAFSPSPEVGWLLFAGATMFCFGLHDWLVLTGRLPRIHGLLIHFSAPVVMVVFGHILIGRFVTALRESEALNVELEARVAAREAQLAANHQRLRMLERDQTIASERERLMRDMHDGVGGTIIAALTMTETPGIDVRRIGEALRHALDDLRLMIDSLDPLEGDLTALLGMFRNRVEPMLRASGLTVTWKLAVLPPCSDLSPERSLQLLRIAQEAISNTLKHARATGLHVTLEPGQDLKGRPAALLTLRDDGCGFDPARTSTGRGLANMWRRAASAGLELSVVPTMQGTLVRVLVPMH
ncbi:MAG: hypothetical protein KIS79_08735 [Burkholderiales bacterium]|nr:hypothetical protein [Burkholderiales bacterium]